MSVQELVRAMEISGYHSPAERLVLLEIAYRSDRRGMVRWSQSEIAGACALSRTTVAQWFGHFEEIGVLTKIGRGRYQLDLRPLDTEPETLLKREPAIKPRPGADEELARLRSLELRDDQAIVFTRGGWPFILDGWENQG